MNTRKRKEFVLAVKPYNCEICKNSGTWEGKYLRLQVDHIDGNSSNDSIENLRFLCPNCHSQTSTFTGKNAKIKNFNKPSKEEFLELLKTHTVKEISILKAVSLRVVYQWFKFYIKERKSTNPSYIRKLTCDKILLIRSSKVPSDKEGLIYGVSGKTIRSIRRLESYRDCN